MQKKRDNDLKEIGLTFSQARVLIIMEEHGGKITQREIEENLHVSHSATHGIVKRLKEKGYVEFSISEKDRRHTTLYITKFGQDKIEYIKTKRQKFPTPIDYLDDKDRKELKKLLKKIIDKICNN